MASGSGVTIVIEARRLPVLPAAQGCLTGGCRRNRDYLAGKMAIDPAVRQELVEVALVPQTSGGLLITLPEECAAGLVSDPKARGVGDATIVGHATVAQDISVGLV